MKEKVNGGMETTLPEEVAPKMKALLAEYNNKMKTCLNVKYGFFHKNKCTILFNITKIV